MRDLCKLFFGPRRRRFEAPEIQISAVAVDCHPVARGDRGISNPRLSCRRVDGEIAASDDAGLPHLPRYQRSMSGTSANHRTAIASVLCVAIISFACWARAHALARRRHCLAFHAVRRQMK